MKYVLKDGLIITGKRDYWETIMADWGVTVIKLTEPLSYDCETYKVGTRIGLRTKEIKFSIEVK